MSQTVDVWVTQKRKNIPMPEMTHGHLLNSMAWVARQLEDYQTKLSGWTFDVEFISEDAIFLETLRKSVEGLKDRQAMLAREWDRRFCLLHEDCRGCAELGAACATLPIGEGR